MNLEPETAGSYVDTQETVESSRLNTIRLQPEDIKSCLNLTQEWDVSLLSHHQAADSVQVQSLSLTQTTGRCSGCWNRDGWKSVSSSTRVTQTLQQFFTISDHDCWFVLSVILIRDNPGEVLYQSYILNPNSRLSVGLRRSPHQSLQAAADSHLFRVHNKGRRDSCKQRLQRAAVLFSRLIWCGTFLTPIRRPWLCAVPRLDGVAVLLWFSVLPVRREWMLKCLRRRCYDRPSWGAPGTWGVYRSAGSDGFVPRWKKLEHQNRINLRWVDNGVRC